MSAEFNPMSNMGMVTKELLDYELPPEEGVINGEREAGGQRRKIKIGTTGSDVHLWPKQFEQATGYQLVTSYRLPFEGFNCSALNLKRGNIVTTTIEEPGFNHMQPTATFNIDITGLLDEGRGKTRFPTKLKISIGLDSPDRNYQHAFIQRNKLPFYDRRYEGRELIAAEYFYLSHEEEKTLQASLTGGALAFFNEVLAVNRGKKLLDFEQTVKQLLSLGKAGADLEASTLKLRDNCGLVAVFTPDTPAETLSN